MPTRLWDVTHLDLDVRIDVRHGTVSGTATHTLAPLGRPRDRVRLHQIGLDVREVRVDGAPTEGVRTGPDWIEVPMPPAPDGVSERTVSIDYRATPANGLHFRGPHRGDAALEVWSQGEDEDNRYWFPSWDHPSDTFTVSTRVTVPSGLVARANGALVAQEPVEPGWTRWSFALEQPIVNYLVAVVAGEYQVVELDGPVPLEILGPRTVPEADLRVGTDQVGRQMAWLTELLGEPYPYPVYRQAWVQGFLYGGMENASLTTLGDEYIGRRGDRQASTDNLVAHELAHHWFGDLIGCYGWRELWLNEGFASAIADRWLEQELGPEHAAAELWDTRRQALWVQRPMSPRAWSRMDDTPYDGEYVKGASVLHMLRVHLGTPTYDAGIRRYVAENRFRLAESGDLRRALEDVSGTHLGWLFDQWVTGAGVAEWSTSWEHEEGVLTVRIEPGEQVFHAPLEIEVGGASGVTRRTIWLDGRPTQLVLDLPDPPAWVAIDPQGGVLGRFDIEQPVEAWTAQLEMSPHAYARIQAMHALGALPPEDAGVDALARVLAGPSVPRYRQDAARALGGLGTHERAVSALLSGTRDAAAPVRESAVYALERVDPTPEVVQRLKDVLATDADLGVAGAALRVLGEHDGPAAAALARKALSRKDPTREGDLHTAALGVLEEHGTEADALAALRLLEPTAAVRSVRVAAASLVVALATDPEHRREKLRDRAAKALIPWLDDADLDVRAWGVASLGSLGRTEDLRVLEAFADRNPVPALDDEARDAMAHIRHPDADDPLEALRERLDALESDADATGERLDALETWR